MLGDLVNLVSSRWSFFLGLAGEHLLISGIAIFFASLIGIFLGILMSERRNFSVPILGLVSFVYTIPSISLLGFLIPFSGIGNRTAMIALTIYGLLPMTRNTYAGIQGIDGDILEAAKGMGSSPSQILFKIKLPLALPMILAGFRNMVVMTIALAGIASFIGAGGLGVAIYRGITTYNEAMTLAGSLGVALLALGADFLIGLIEKSVTRRRGGSGKRILFGGLIVIGLLALIPFMMSEEPKKEITIATKPMTEQLIMGEMLSMVLEEKGNYSVKLVKGVGGGTSNIHPALLKGTFDLYPEYTGTSWSFVLKKKVNPPFGELYPELQKEYKEQYQLEWGPLLGFNNTFGLAIRKEMADQYGIVTYSDLAKHSQGLVFGAEYDFFERDDGYLGLSKGYGFTFAKPIDMDIGLKYKALLSKQVDVITVFTTDGQLSNPELILLKDDRNYFESYYCGLVVRQDTLQKNPSLKGILGLLEDKITEADMARMNHEVETNGRNEQDVAREFLLSKGLLEVKK